MRSDHIDRAAERHHEHPHHIKPNGHWARFIRWRNIKIHEWMVRTAQWVQEQKW